ncbi:MAG: hypothetical protein K0Q72_4000, partial [Armatimonadetes bacterium]|nr:hypothetical protein [Armatimonadota bacterium]
MSLETTPSETTLLNPALPLSALDTPALLVDLDLLQHNLERMATGVRALGCSIRPHFKS